MIMTKEKKEKVEIAIMGGTGVYDPGELTNTKQIKVYTPYGATSELITIGDYAGKRVAFLPRHGRNHHVPPHNIPFRANIWALNELGVKRIIAPCAVGSLREELPPEHIVFPDQFYDNTKNRDYSFYDGGEVCHMSVAEPFCNELRKFAVESAKEMQIGFQEHGTSVCIEGPRFSTKPESIFYRDAIKAHVIGMTLVPECILAREKQICYLPVAMVTDYDVWHEKPVSTEFVKQTMQKNITTIRNLLINLLPKIPTQRTCDCESALDDAFI
jgi:5'-methylthioadenosine phosphorylase